MLKPGQVFNNRYKIIDEKIFVKYTGLSLDRVFYVALSVSEGSLPLKSVILRSAQNDKRKP